MFIITYRKFFFWLTGLVLAAALGAILAWGLPLGIDFTGGTMMQVSYPNGRPELSSVQEQIVPVSLGSVSARAVGTDTVSLRTRSMSQEEHDAVLTALSAQGSITELSYTSVGPALGSQFASKAIWAIFAVIFVIVLYIAFAFRKV